MSESRFEPTKLQVIVGIFILAVLAGTLTYFEPVIQDILARGK